MSRVRYRPKEQVMIWYAAHIIMYVQFKDGDQKTYPFWENIVLLGAESTEEAVHKAELLGKQREGDHSGSFTWEMRPATWVFGGIRKINKCDDSEERPKDGTEITYSVMEAPSQDALKQIINGESASIVYAE